ncbi:hypothetical protein MPS_3881 [Mycobacterium pseudoshottsii JCM 15466]|nr:hypothetical protein MPS_3881 [Mycobacterium pseudoshottsii JCM 15466]
MLRRVWWLPVVVYAVRVGVAKTLVGGVRERCYSTFDDLIFLQMHR